MGPMLSKATPVEVWEEPNPRSGGLSSMEPLSRDLPACPASPTWREASWGRVMTQTPAFPLPMALEPFRPQSTRAPSYHSRGQRSALASWPWREGGEEGREPMGSGVQDASFPSSPSSGPSLGLFPAGSRAPADSPEKDPSTLFCPGPPAHTPPPERQQHQPSQL